MILPSQRTGENSEASSYAIWRRYKVTVCIAAFAEHEGQLVFVADSRVAYGDFSSDKGGVKYELLGNTYIVQIAGNDIVYALPTIRKARNRILRDHLEDPDEVADLVHAELCAARDRIVEAKVLKKYKMTIEQFLARGRKAFTEQVYANICTRIEQQNLSLTFTVAGFDRDKKAHLRVVTVDEPPCDFDGIGYAAIGTGAQAAMASLSFAKDHAGFGRDSSLEDVTSHLLAAKFMAESATDVGQDTFFLSVGFARGVCHMMTVGATEALRKTWKKDGAPRHSKKSVKILKDVIYKNTEHFLSRSVLERCFKYFSRRQKKLFKLFLTDDMQEKISGSTSTEELLKLEVPTESASTPSSVQTSADQR